MDLRDDRIAVPCHQHQSSICIFFSYFCIKLSDIKGFGKRRIAYCLYSVDDSENLYNHVIIIIYTCDLTVFGRLFGVFLLTVVFFKSYVDVTCAGVRQILTPG